MGKKKDKRKATGFVLDCSVTVAWFFEDETDAYVEAVEDSLPMAAAVVEVMNVRRFIWPIRACDV